MDGKAEKYKVFLIDDEPWALIYLEKIVDWNAHGFEVTGKYDSSVEGFNKAVSDTPDLIFIDIRMPGMDGLEFIKKVIDAGLRCRFVIVSGFAEFSYAQKAIGMGVVNEYCLKPIAKEQMESLLVKLYAELEARSKEQESEVIPRAENPVFQELLTYMHTHFQEKLVLRELAGQFHLNANYCCALFNKETGGSFSEYLSSIRMKEAQRLLIHTSFSVEEIAEQCGMRDYCYFNKVFKKYSGETPGQYRKKIKHADGERK